jgi:hypothetical protein
VNLLGENLNTIHKNKETPSGTSKHIGLEATPADSSPVCRVIWVADRPFENVAKFKLLGMTVTNQSLINVELKIIRKSGNPCCHSVKNVLVF